MKKYISLCAIVCALFMQVHPLEAQIRPFFKPIGNDGDGAGLGPGGEEASDDSIVDAYGNPVGNEEEFRFNLRFDNFGILTTLQSRIANSLLAQKRIDDWLKDQEKTFLKEINKQMGKNYTSFSTAQKEFFKYFENRSGYYGPVETTSRLRGGQLGNAKANRQKRETHGMEIIALDKWKACNYCTTYADLEVQGEILRDLDHDSGPGPKFWQPILRNNAVESFGEAHYLEGYNSSVANGLGKLIQSGILLNRLTGYRVDHYRRLGLQDKVFQMSAYLILTGAIRTNYIQYPLPNNLRKYNPPQYWDNDRLLEWGEELGPDLPFEQFVFSEQYLQDQLTLLTTGPYGTWSKQAVIDLVEKEREEVIDDMLGEVDFFDNLALFEMENILNRLNEAGPDCPDCKYFNGTIAGSGLESLSYFRFKKGSNGGRYFNLNNGLWVAEFAVPQRTIGSPEIPDGVPHTNGGYYYIYDHNQKGWIELDIPVTAGGDFLNIDEYLGEFLLEGGKQFVAIATPVEDFMVIITGKDLSGINQSRLEAGVWLVFGVIPGAKVGKVLKPVLSAAKKSRVGKLIKIGNTYVVRLIEPISTVIKSRIKSVIDGNAISRLDDAVNGGDFFKENIEDTVEEIAEDARRKGRKLNWDELKALFKRGNDFNDKARAENWYRVRELNLIDKKRLDGYVPGREIVSRKATDLDKIQFSTFEKYVNEIAQKYPRGKKIRSNAYPELDGQTLQGEYILEIPASNQFLPNIRIYINYARKKGVTIRFRPE